MSGVGWAVAATVATAGWALAALLAATATRMRRRLELVDDAVHELRGPAAAVSLAVATLRRQPGGVGRMLILESELERMRAGLADLDAARTGRRARKRPVALPLEAALRRTAAGWRVVAGSGGRGLRMRWEAGRAVVLADRERLSQALGNLVANAVEHGTGPVELHAARRGPRSVRVEVRDGGAPAAVRPCASPAPGRGRGLEIAARAVEEAGGCLMLERRAGGTTAAIELPLIEPDE